MEDLFGNSERIEEAGLAENKLLREENGRSLKSGEDNLKRGIFESPYPWVVSLEMDLTLLE